MMQNNSNCCNDNCNQGRDCPVRAGTHKPAEALHQIQEPDAAEQAAWFAGLDEGRTQAAPAAVAVPDELEAFEAKFPMPAHCMRCGDGYASTSFNGWDAYKHVERWEGWQARAALAATPAAGFDVRKSDNNAAAPVVLPEHAVYVHHSMEIDGRNDTISAMLPTGTKLYTEPQLRALLATGGQAQAVERGEVLVTVSGFTGSGKSAIAGEIEILCRALGLQVEWPDGESEKNMTHADWTAALEQYKPRVRIVEQNIPFASKKGLSE